MLILLTGGSGNGKSTFAVKLLSELRGARYLVDTATVYDAAEAALRKQKQQELEQQGIRTLSCGSGLNALQFPAGSSAILECMCHLTANEMFGGEQPYVEQRDQQTVFFRILSKIEHLLEQCEHLIIVTNEVGCEGLRYDDGTESYKRLLGLLNNTLARRADCVCEVVCGFPLVRKGTLPGDAPEINAGDGPLLVVGPENSGKRDYVRSLGYSEKQMSGDLHSGCPVLLDLHRLLQNGSDPEELMPLLLRKKVIVCSEVGSGIIPVSPELTRARVLTGKLCNQLAQQASSVVRILCGIPTKIK